MYKNSLKHRNIADLQALTPGRLKKITLYWYIIIIWPVMISFSPRVAPLRSFLTEGSEPAYTHWDASWGSNSVLSRATWWNPPVTKYVWVKRLQSQYNVPLTTYHLVIVVVIATTVCMSRCLQAGQQSGLPLGVVPHHSGDAIIIRANVSSSSCDDDLAAAGNIDTTSIAAMKYQ